MLRMSDMFLEQRMYKRADWWTVGAGGIVMLSSSRHSKSGCDWLGCQGVHLHYTHPQYPIQGPELMD